MAWPEDVGSVPDWDRVLVESRAMGEGKTTLGDATRWGSQGSLTLPLAVGVYASDQLIWVQNEDQYSRNWQIIGNVELNANEWDNIIPLAGDPLIVLSLEVTMGVGQITVLQRFNLGTLIDLASTWYVDGAGVDNNGDPTLIKAWAISGGIIGRMISARVVANVLEVGYEDLLIVPVQAMISPYANGVV